MTAPTEALAARVKPNVPERTFVIVALASVIGLPPLFLEAFPLSTCSMFAHPAKEWRVYQLFDAQGKQLSNDAYGLRTNPNWYLEPYYAVKYPKNLVSPGDRSPDITKVLDEIQRGAVERGERFPLRLSCRTLGPVDNHSVGNVDKKEWLIEADASHDIQ